MYIIYMCAFAEIEIELNKSKCMKSFIAKHRKKSNSMHIFSKTKAYFKGNNGSIDHFVRNFFKKRQKCFREVHRPIRHIFYVLEKN